MDIFARIDDARRECDVLEHPFYQRWSAGELSAEELDLYAGEYRHAVVALARASSDAAAKAGPEHRAGLARHAAEEHSHIALWDEFARAAGAAADRDASLAGAQNRDASLADAQNRDASLAGAQDRDASLAGAQNRDASLAGAQNRDASLADALPETEACARAWAAGDDLLEHLAVLYAIEASQPRIAETKLDGLLRRYGYTPEGPAVEYFRLHATLDVEHARQARVLIEELMSSEQARACEQADRMVERAEAALRGNWTLLDGVERRFARHAECGRAGERLHRAIG
ncbi:MAG TPA: iron-containing redox enzyme family protein [Solirubrobacteraceae bacterium]